MTARAAIVGDSHLWLDPGFGASGDMLLGCLVGLGAPLPSIVSKLRTLDLDQDSWQLEQARVTRNSLSATRVSVQTTEGHHHRTWSSIDAMLAQAATSAALPEAVVTGARRTFRRLGQIEAEMHNVTIDEVHFHEVGALDAILDITGVWLALDELRRIHGDLAVTAGPVGLGHGTVSAAHGLLPIPAPATAALLTGVPIQSSGQSETVTPTGAALLTTMVDDWRPLPTGRLVAVSRGAGGRDPAGYPNVVTGYLVSGSLSDAVSGSLSDSVPDSVMATQEPGLAGAELTATTTTLLATNLDDVTGEVLGHTIERCLQAGADDAWAQPIVMKKGRPGHALSVMCSPDLADQLRDLIMAETGTLGVRRQLVTKEALPRTTVSVTVEGQSIRIKVGPNHAKPEFDDLASAAEATGLTVKHLAQRALATFTTDSGVANGNIDFD